MSDDRLTHLRIRKMDIVMVCETVEITNGKVMMVEIEGQRQLRQARKENKNIVLLSDGNNNKDSVRYPANRVRVLGLCVKVEFYL